MKLHTLLIMFGVGGMFFAPAFAHTTVSVGQYDIEVGWDIEPPIVGIRNNFVFDVSVPGEVEGVKTGVKNAFRDLDATAKFGGITKQITVNSDPRPGHYYSSVIPTKVGSMSIQITGTIDGTTVDVDIPVEDVETTAVLDFPPRTGASDDDTAGLKNAITSLQQEVSTLKSQMGSTADAGPAYDFAVVGLSLAGAAIVLAIVAMLKRKSN